MVQPLVLCLERVGLENDRYVRCTARVGREAGLAIGDDGTILWLSEAPGAVELWVAGDGRLMAVRRDGVATITLHRAGRSLVLPTGQRGVVVLHEDELVVEDARFRIHQHGRTEFPFAPRVLQSASRAALMAGLVAAAAAGCGDGPDPLVNRAPPGSGGTAGSGGAAVTDEPIVAPTSGGAGSFPPPTEGGAGGAIEVRSFPPFQ